MFRGFFMPKSEIMRVQVVLTESGLYALRKRKNLFCSWKYFGGHSSWFSDVSYSHKFTDEKGAIKAANTVMEANSKKGIRWDSAKLNEKVKKLERAQKLTSRMIKAHNDGDKELEELLIRQLEAEHQDYLT